MGSESATQAEERSVNMSNATAIKANKSTKIRKSKEDIIIDILVYAFLAIPVFVSIYPMYFVVISSFSSPAAVSTGEVIFWIVDFSLDGYRYMFEEEQIWIGYGNTIFYTVLGTTLNVIVTMLLAYPLSRSYFSGKRPIMSVLIFTMYFSGGLIPTFMLVNDMGLYNTRTIMLILGLYSVHNVIITRTFLKQNIPDELEEAAFIDGCTSFQFFYKMVLPLSGAIMSVLVLYYGIGNWNEYMNALIYLSDSDKQPLQIVLRQILIQTSNIASEALDEDLYAEQMRAAEAMKYSTIIVASLPVMVLYPLLQKKFERGVMSGAMKG